MAFSSLSLKVSFSIIDAILASGSLASTGITSCVFSGVSETFLSLEPQLTTKINSKLAKNLPVEHLMKFSFFSEQVVKLKNLPLPGVNAHFKMEPEVRKRLREQGYPKNKQPKKAAVMSLFYPKEDETYLLLILRKSYPGVHSNQIGFPGGKEEQEDRDALSTAIRETYEEVGVPTQSIEMVKQLTEVYIPPSNFLVQPFIGLYRKPVPFVMDPVEVEALVEVPLVDFLDDSNLIHQTLSTSYAHEILVPAFKLNGYTVWGATAMMLSEIKDLLKQVL